jgi:hypothetical protein
LQNGTHRGKGGAADQSMHGWIGLMIERKDVTLRMKNVSIQSSDEKKLCLWIEKKCVFAEKFVYTAYPRRKGQYSGRS